MREKKALPIGNDDFRKIREENFYYVDKTLMIRDFIESKDSVTLIARPRRFGKTLNMTMMREFFDISVNSKKIFEGLAIMETEYAGLINSKPVIFLSFKDCKARTARDLELLLKDCLYREYLRYENIFRDKLEETALETKDFYKMIDTLRNPETGYNLFSFAILRLTEFVKDRYAVAPVLLIDEYDQPIISSYQHGYHDETGDFFSVFYGSAMKSNPSLGQALLTGVQRVAKESIFSQFNNVRVYTVLDKKYAPYFGLTEKETEETLNAYNLALDEAVQKKYNGYRFGGLVLYNPWSVLNYADFGVLDNYWINTSSNFLVKQALQRANKPFWDKFAKLVSGMEIPVGLTLETSY
ncbi:MAG: AAA family ATPase, partial [Clostridiales bacterium]|nr:AAA family ATPase [Clostridiales bacterium]